MRPRYPIVDAASNSVSFFRNSRHGFVKMKATFARMRSVLGSLERPEVPVTVPTGPRAKKNFMMVTSRDFEIYPLVLCVSVGYAIGAFSLLRHAMWDPDVNGNPYRRETPAWDRYKPEEGQAVSRNHHLFANLKPNPVNTFSKSFKHQEETDDVHL